MCFVPFQNNLLNKFNTFASEGLKSKTFNCLVLIAFDQRGYICYDKEPRFTWPHSKDRLVASYDQAMCTEAISFFPESPWD